MVWSLFELCDVQVLRVADRPCEQELVLRALPEHAMLHTARLHHSGFVHLLPFMVCNDPRSHWHRPSVHAGC